MDEDNLKQLCLISVLPALVRVWFFPTLKKSAEGRILYEKTEKHVYVYDTIIQKRFSSFSAWIKALSSQQFFKDKKSALATIFLKPNCNEMNIQQIIKGKNYSPYFKNIQIVTLLSIKDTLTTMIYDDVELIEVRDNFLEENKKYV
ncbi:30158_t:CDS:2, partial [Gigaspora margarita]